MKKKVYRILIWIISSLALMAILYFVLLEIHPKNARRVPFYLVLLYFDIFLWVSVWKYLRNKNSLLKKLLTFLYWIPLTGTAIIALISFSHPTYLWSDFWRIYPGGIIFSAYLAKMIPVVFLLISSLLKSINVVSIDRNREISPLKVFVFDKVPYYLTFTGWTAGGIFFLFLIMGILVFSGRFEVNHQPVAINELPASFNGFKIIHLSDFHLGSWHSKNDLQKAVILINTLDPDIVVFTGDMVNFVAAEALPFTHILKEIKAKQGIYCILGNHDYGDYVKWHDPAGKEANMVELFDFYKSIGWTLLANESRLLRKSNDSILLAGVENWGRLARFPKKGDVKKALQGFEKVPVKILLSHDPTHFEDVVSRYFTDIDLTLSGHVHGFQIGLKFGTWKFSLAQYTYRFWDGFYAFDLGPDKKQYLYVNRGLGSLLYPGRLGMPPEITLIELKQNQSP